MEIENEKLKKNDDEEIKKRIEYDYLLQQKRLDKDHEINKIQDEKLKIKAYAHNAENQREMIKLERQMNVDMAFTKGEIKKIEQIVLEEISQNKTHEITDYIHEGMPKINSNNPK